MGTLPTSEQLTSTTITTAQYKSAIANLRDYVSQLIGGNNREVLIVSESKIIPTKGIIDINISDSVTSDVLNTIDMTNFSEGQCLLLTLTSVGDTLTIKNDFGGYGSIYMANDRDLTMVYGQSIFLVRTGTAWYEKSFSSFLFGDTDIIKESFLPISSETVKGIVKKSSQSDLENKSVDSFVSAKQLMDTKDTIDLKIDNMIYPKTSNSQQEQITNIINIKKNVYNYKVLINSETTLTIATSEDFSSDAIIFELVVTMGGDYIINFPDSVVFMDENVLNLTSGKNYIIKFRSYNQGVNWIAEIVGSY